MTVTAITNIDVYYNLHRHLWSCKCRSTGRVIRHAHTVVTPFSAKLVVREAGRQQVLREGRKNVHAFARVGDADTAYKVDGWEAFAKGLPGVVQVSYNPYRAGYFYDKATGDAVADVKSLIMLAPTGMHPQVWAVV